MNVAIDEGGGELPNDTSLALNGPRSEEISQNFPRDEDFEENEIMQSVVQHDSDGYGGNDCNVIFDCNSGDDAKLTGDEGSAEENLQIFEENFPRGDGGAPGILVPPAAMADQNAAILRRTSSKASRRAKKMVGVSGSENAPAQSAVEVSEWGEVDLVIWPDNDTKNVGKHAARGVLNLPRDFGVQENQRGEVVSRTGRLSTFFRYFLHLRWLKWWFQRRKNTWIGLLTCKNHLQAS